MSAHSPLIASTGPPQLPSFPPLPALRSLRPTLRTSPHPQPATLFTPPLDPSAHASHRVSSSAFVSRADVVDTAAHARARPEQQAISSTEEYGTVDSTNAYVVSRSRTPHAAASAGVVRLLSRCCMAWLCIPICARVRCCCAWARSTVALRSASPRARCALRVGACGSPPCRRVERRSYTVRRRLSFWLLSFVWLICVYGLKAKEKPPSCILYVHTPYTYTVLSTELDY